MKTIRHILIPLLSIIPAMVTGSVEKLPVLAEGPHAGKHLFYEHEHFQFWIDADGAGWVQPMDAGRPAGKSFKALAVEPYVTTSDGIQLTRNIVSFDRFSEPKVLAKTGGTVRFTGMLENEVPFEAEYDIRNNTVLASGGCKDPRKIQYPTQFRFLSRFTNMPGIGSNPSDEEIAAKTKGMELVVQFEQSRGESTFALGTTQPMDNFHLPMKSATLKGTNGPREIEFRPVGKDGVLRGFIYGGNLWQDFVIQYIAPAPKSRPSSTRTSMTIR